MLRAALLLLSLLLSLLLCAARGVAQDAEELTKDIYRSDRYQTELPRNTHSGGLDKSSRTKRTRRDEGAGGRIERRSSRTRQWRQKSDFDLGIILWVAGAAVAALFVVALIGRLQAAGRDVEFVPTGDVDTSTKRAPTISEDVLDEAKALAGRGDFARAVRTLLLGTFESLRAQRVVPSGEAWTSRALLARAELSKSARAALRDLVDAVERGIFAKRPVERADFERCMTAFENLSAQTAAEAQAQE